jgi:hypothetical protein
MTSIIDTNHDVTDRREALGNLGIKTVIRYLSAINPGGEKSIKPPEARAIAAAGIRLGLVCEGWGDFAHGGISAVAGQRDAAFCVRQAPAVGAPPDACIYFAVDVDADAGQIGALVIPYFRSIADVMSAGGYQYRIGVYGSGDVCDAVAKAGLADLTWLSCSLGWSGSRAYRDRDPAPWALLQHVPQTIAGIDTDPDEANGDCGDFVPFASAPPVVA